MSYYNCNNFDELAYGTNNPCFRQCFVPVSCVNLCPTPCPPCPPPTRGNVRRSNLVTNLIAGPPVITDPDVINSWGIVIINGILWVVNNGTGLVTTYSLNGTKLPTTVTVPNTEPVFPPQFGAPTGIVHNTTGGFSIGNSLPALWLTATENGTINAYVPSLDPANAPVVVNRSGLGAVYKGLTIAGNLLYAADFHNNRIDVFDANFVLQPFPSFPFIDPELPSGYAPFNIQNINGLLYVTYALQKPPENKDDQAGPGNGFINVFSPTGGLIRRFASQGPLNSPWAVTLASVSLDFPAETILIGNFGDGKINAFDINGVFLGSLKECDGITDLVIDGLWGLYGNIYPGTLFANTLFFASGPNNEENGLVGKLSSDC